MTVKTQEARKKSLVPTVDEAKEKAPPKKMAEEVKIEFQRNAKSPLGLGIIGGSDTALVSDCVRF